MGLLLIPLYLMVRSPALLGLGALLMSIGGPGMWGVVPTYLTERFPTAARGAGASSGMVSATGSSVSVGAGVGGS